MSLQPCDNPEQIINQQLDRYKETLSNFIKGKEDFIKKELEHFKIGGNPGGSSRYNSNGLNFGGGEIGNIFQNGLGSIQNLAKNYIDGKLNQLLEETIGKTLGIDINGDMFKDWKSAFKTLATALWSMQMTNKNTMWNFIDYARKSYVEKLKVALDDLKDLKTFTNNLINTYESLNGVEIHSWIDNYKEILHEVVVDLEEADEKLSMLEAVLYDNNVLNNVLKEDVINILSKNIIKLSGNNEFPEAITSIILIREDVKDILKECNSSMASVRTVYDNHKNMPNQLQNLKIESIYGSKTLKKANLLLKTTISSITAKENEISETIPTTSFQKWSIDLDSVRAFLRLLETDYIPDPNSQQFIQTTNFGDFLAINPIDNWDSIKEDILKINKLIKKLYTDGKNVNITSIKQRLTQNIDNLINTLENTKNELESLLPQRMSTDVSSITSHIMASGFDNWINCLLNGDIMGFLTMTFGNSSSATQLIEIVGQLINCKSGAVTERDLITTYKLAKKEAERSQNASLLLQLDPFEKLYQDNLEKNKERLRKIESKVQSIISKYKL